MFVKNVFNYNLYVNESAPNVFSHACNNAFFVKKKKDEKAQVLSKDINKILYKHDRQCLLNLNLA